MEQPRKHLTIRGSGAASGGQYDHVSVYGTAVVDGHLACTRLTVFGVLDVDGTVTSQRMKIKGQADFGGGINTEEAHIHGLITVAGDCNADRLFVNGAFTVEGLLNVGTADIRLHGPSRAKEIGGGTIRINRPRWRVFNFHVLTVESVEGDDIEIDNTCAKVVRGNNVRVGSGCEIDLIEYRGLLKQARGAKVGEIRKL